MIKILAIGNSFSRNANRYFYDIAAASGVDIKNVNLYIGGCPLSRHFRNIMSNSEAYELQIWGRSTGISVSVDKLLLSDNWDYITLQQASHESYAWKNYEPYLERVAEHVRSLCPGAKLGIHETWAWKNQERVEKNGFDSPEDMFRSVKACYEKAAKTVDADFYIPGGSVIMEGLRRGLEVYAADGSHAGPLGEYMLGLAWNSVICGKDAMGNSFIPKEEQIDEMTALMAQKTTAEVLSR